MKGKRPAPVDPPQMAIIMRERVASGELSFTSKADVEKVIALYEKGFVKAMNNAIPEGDDYRAVYYVSLGFTDKQIPDIVGTLKYAADACTLKDVTFWFTMNDFTERGKAKLKACAVPGKINVEY